MEITEVKVKLVQGEEKMLAYASITLDDCFVIHDIRILRTGEKERILVAMPSRKVSDYCNGCNFRNPLLAKYCNNCAAPLGEAEIPLGRDGRPRIYVDICYPIRVEMRRKLEDSILEQYHKELEHLSMERRADETVHQDA